MGGPQSDEEDASGGDGEDEDVEAGDGTHEFECTKCGYVLFPAAGREFKFFGAGFTCPGPARARRSLSTMGRSERDEGERGAHKRRVVGRVEIERERVLVSEDHDEIDMS